MMTDCRWTACYVQCICVVQSCRTLECSQPRHFSRIANWKKNSCIHVKSCRICKKIYLLFQPKKPVGELSALDVTYVNVICNDSTSDVGLSATCNFALYQLRLCREKETYYQPVVYSFIIRPAITKKVYHTSWLNLNKSIISPSFHNIKFMPLCIKSIKHMEVFEIICCLRVSTA